ncbi:MAG: hypothetical protein HY870_03180 [Chloroflexi bacterium]|nr:hypothetical protein [Chloroflexota bacterium]
MNSPSYGAVQTSPSRCGPGHVGPSVAVNVIPDFTATVGSGAGVDATVGATDDALGNVGANSVETGAGAGGADPA